ncbi:MAG: antitoxin [Spirochaetaceae bacterium]|nr:MAG: antitoxin [Spirochaetaceae bacterium]
MKTTFDLPDALYRQIKIHAAERGVTVREVVIESLQYGLNPRSRETAHVAEVASEHSRRDEYGWPVLSRPDGDEMTVTDAMVNHLREREGV